MINLDNWVFERFIYVHQSLKPATKNDRNSSRHVFARILSLTFTKMKNQVMVRMYTIAIFENYPFWGIKLSIIRSIRHVRQSKTKNSLVLPLCLVGTVEDQLHSADVGAFWRNEVWAAVAEKIALYDASRWATITVLHVVVVAFLGEINTVPIDFQTLPVLVSRL